MVTCANLCPRYKQCLSTTLFSVLELFGEHFFELLERSKRVENFVSCSRVKVYKDPTFFGLLVFLVTGLKWLEFKCCFFFLVKFWRVKTPER
jgi:hypothetical protein